MTSVAIRHKKIIVERFGGPERLRLADAVTPPAQEGHARVKVSAAGVGYTDVMARRGEYLLQRRRPFTPGYELVGEIVDYRIEPGRPVPSWLAPGARVAACLPRMGAYTEYRTLPISALVPVPAELDVRIAAAITLDWLTAVSLLERHARVNPKDVVLIHGATGGVGDALCQLGARQGLTMYGTASQRSITRLERYDLLPVDYRSDRLEPTIRRRHPDGVHAVFDHIGGSSMHTNHRLLAPGGVLVSYAFAGRPGRVLADTVRGALHNRVLALAPGRRTAICSLPKEINSDPYWYRDSLSRLFDLARRREIQPEVGAVFPLSEAASAHVALERREISGKILLSAP
ncbi:medium chain dehydrogenase/reductase family protein [Actinoallomurus acanthiterrae]